MHALAIRFLGEPNMEHASSYHIEDYLQPGKHCHLVGIGGVSMRPLGLVLRRMGMEISGSDMNASVSTDELISKGRKYRERRLPHPHGCCAQ